MNRELIPQIESLVELLNEWRGELVEVVEQINRSPGTLDRHFTTYTSFSMRLECVSIAFSGASLMVLGKAFERDVGYQATCDLLEELTMAATQVVFVERFGTKAERHSTFRLLGNKTPPQDLVRHLTM